MNTFIWFTYKRHEAFLVQSLRSVLENVSSDKRLCVVFDSYYGDSISDATMDIISNYQNKYGVEIIVTSANFYRRGNLNGTECINGMLSFFNRFQTNSDAIFKIDSDVILFKQNYINTFLSNSKYLSMGCQRHIFKPDQFDKGLIYGSFYGLKSELLEYINREVNHASNFEEYIEHVTASNPLVHDNLQEDLTFSMIIKSITSDEQRLWPEFTLGKGMMAGWQFKNNTYSNGYKFYDIINFGNRYLIKADGTDEVYRIAEKNMRESLDEYLDTKP